MSAVAQKEGPDLDLHTEIVKLSNRLRVYAAALHEAGSDGNIAVGVQEMLESDDEVMAKLEKEAGRVQVAARNGGGA